jgi:hypothetical protein
VTGEDDTERFTFQLAYAGTFSALLGGAMAGLFLCVRSGLDSPWLAVAFGAVLLAAAALAPLAAPARWRSGYATYPFVPSLLTLAVLLSPMLARLTGRSLLIVYPALAAAGLIRAIGPLTRAGAGGIALLIVGPLLVAPYLFLEIHRYAYAHVFAPEYALLGPRFLQLDTVFHMSIAHMIQNYGGVSTGLDGLLPFRYHVASHAWLAGIGALVGTPPVFTYPLAQIIIAVPGLVAAALLAIVCLRPRGERLVTSVLVTLALVCVLDAIGWTTHYISESQTLGLVVVLLAVPLLADFIATRDRSGAVAAIRVIAAVIVVFIATATKVSAGVVLGAGFGWALLRGARPPLEKVATVCALAMTGVIAVHYFQPRTGLSLAESFVPFAFYRSGFGYGNSPVAAHASLILPFAFVGLQLCRRQLTRTGEVVLIATLVALVPGLTLRMWGGAGWWFWSAAQWLTLPFVVSAFDGGARRLPKMLGAVVVGLVIVGTSFRFDASRLVVLAAGLCPDVPPQDISRHLRASFATHGTLFGPEVRKRLEESEGARLAAAVHRTLPDDRRGVAVFVPPSNHEFWQRKEPWGCWRRPLYVPALTGVPLLKGLGPHCAPAGPRFGRGFRDYDLRARAAEMSDQELCRHAIEKDITTVMVLMSLVEPSRNRLVECGASANGHTDRGRP